MKLRFRPKNILNYVLILGLLVSAIAAFWSWQRYQQAITYWGEERFSEDFWLHPDSVYLEDAIYADESFEFEIQYVSYSSKGILQEITFVTGSEPQEQTFTYDVPEIKEAGNYYKATSKDGRISEVSSDDIFYELKQGYELSLTQRVNLKTGKRMIISSWLYTNPKN